jgi:hypothetical protein
MLSSYSTGTVSVAAGGTTVTLVGGLWSSVNARPGDMIAIGNGLALLADVPDTLHATIPAWGGGAQAAVAYTVYQVSPLRFAGAQAMADVSTLVAAFNTSGFIFFVPIGAASPDPSYGNEGQYAHQPSTGLWWQKLSGVWTATGAPIAGYGGTSATSLAIGTGAKVFATQINLAYNGARVRAASAAAPAANWMEGVCSYAGGTLTMTADASFGSGSHADWLFSIAGQPQSFDTLSVHGADIPSAATLNLETATGYLVDITGTAGITAITLGEGHRRVTRFAGVVAIAASGSLVPPYGAGYATTAGDIIEWVGYAGGIVCAASILPASAVAARTAIFAAPTSALAFNNMAINPGMEIDQEHVGAAVTLTATGSLQFTYLLDGVMAGYRGTFIANAQQVAAPAGMPAKNALKITVGTAQASLGANDELTIMFPVEGVRTSRLLLGTGLASPQSLGFWIQGHRNAAYSGSIMNAAKTRAYPFSFAITAADTPQWISFSRATASEILADTAGTWLNDINVGMYISICLAGGSSRVGAAAAWTAPASPGLVGVTGTTNGVAAISDVFYISNVISLPGLELPASAATSLMVRPFDQELSLCMRHWEKSYPYATALGTASITGAEMFIVSASSGATVGKNVDFKIAKRAAPSAVLFSTQTGTSGKIYDAIANADVAGNADILSENGMRNYATLSASGGGMSSYWHWKANARLV